MDRRRFVAMMGSALAAPYAHAQKAAKPVRIGFLSTSLEVFKTPFWNTFYVGMSKRGWRKDNEYVVEARESRADPA